MTLDQSDSNPDALQIENLHNYYKSRQGIVRVERRGESLRIYWTVAIMVRLGVTWKTVM